MRKNARTLVSSLTLPPDRPHYGAEFRIEVVDASTEKPVGTSLVTTQSLLQRQRDAFVAKHGIPFVSVIKGPPGLSPQRLVLELRIGMKSGYSSDFFAPSMGKSTSDKAGPGTFIARNAFSRDHRLMSGAAIDR